MYIEVCVAWCRPVGLAVTLCGVCVLSLQESTGVVNMFVCVYVCVCVRVCVCVCGVGVCALFSLPSVGEDPSKQGCEFQ